MTHLARAKLGESEGEEGERRALALCRPVAPPALMWTPWGPFSGPHRSPLYQSGGNTACSCYPHTQSMQSAALRLFLSRWRPDGRQVRRP